MHRAPSRLVLRSLVLASLGAALVAAAVGCKNDETTTPACVSDVSDQGIIAFDGGGHVDGGCNPYPTCRDDQGNVLPAQACCIGPDAGKNAQPTSDQLTCLCGYGVGHCDNLGSGGAGTGGHGTTGAGGHGGTGAGGKADGGK
jgi:hypothetical protein